MNLITDVLAAHTLALRIDEERKIVDCGHIAMPDLFLVPDWQRYADTAGKGTTGGTGYATLTDGRKICYPCADEMQSAEMDTAERMPAYLSSDGSKITTWTGGILAAVAAIGTGRRITPTGGEWTAHYVTAFRNGVEWYGVNSGKGMAITLRRVKKN